MNSFIIAPMLLFEWVAQREDILISNCGSYNGNTMGVLGGPRLAPRTSYTAFDIGMLTTSLYVTPIVNGKKVESMPLSLLKCHRARSKVPKVGPRYSH